MTFDDAVAHLLARARRHGGVLTAHEVEADPRFAAEPARDLGAVVMELEADPNAVLFYEKMGARQVGQTTNEWGRTLPVMSLNLVGTSPANDEPPSSISPLG
jgi:hypothetical protein